MSGAWCLGHTGHVPHAQASCVASAEILSELSKALLALVTVIVSTTLHVEFCPTGLSKCDPHYFILLLKLNTCQQIPLALQENLPLGSLACGVLSLGVLGYRPVFVSSPRTLCALATLDSLHFPDPGGLL